MSTVVEQWVSDLEAAARDHYTDLCIRGYPEALATQLAATLYALNLQQAFEHRNKSPWARHREVVLYKDEPR